jgi:hypothetical protein
MDVYHAWFNLKEDKAAEDHHTEHDHRAERRDRSGHP